MQARSFSAAASPPIAQLLMSSAQTIHLIRSIRVPALALCTLTVLAACQKDNLSQSTSQSDSEKPKANDTQGRKDVSPQATLASVPETLFQPGSAGKADLTQPQQWQAKLAKSLSLASQNAQKVQRGLPAIPVPRLPTLPSIDSLITQSLQSASELTDTSTPTDTAADQSSANQSSASPAAEPVLISNLATTASIAAPEASPPEPSAASSTAFNPAPDTDKSNSSDMSDVQGHWAQKFVDRLAAAGVIKSFDDGTFKPDDLITQDQFTAMMHRAFPDRSDDQMPQFNPNATRAEVAKLIYETLTSEGRLQADTNSIAAQPAVQDNSATATLVAANSDAALSGALAAARAVRDGVTPTPTTPAEPSDADRSSVADPAQSAAPSDKAQSAAQSAAQSGAAPSAAVQPSSIGETAVAPAAESAPPIANAEARLPRSTTGQSAGMQVAASSIADTAYTLGTGDVVQIDILNVPEYSGQRQVLADGTLSVPVVGNILVRGLTLDQAKQTIAASYVSLVRNPVVTLTLLQSRPLRVSIAGEVNRPGAYTLPLTDNRQFPSLVQAIQAAAGLTQAADLRHVQIQRPRLNAAPQLIAVNLLDLLQNSNLNQDVTLRDGDNILVPASAQPDPAASSQVAASNLAASVSQFNVAVVGEVARPGTYRVGEQATATAASEQGSAPPQQPTVTQAIQLAGGITGMANIRQIQVKRLTRNGADQVINVDLWKLLQEGDTRQDVVLQQGDTISIPTAPALSAAEATALASVSFAPDKIQVGVVGEVTNPGRIEVAPNTPLNQAILAAGGFNRRARKTVQLIRLNPNGTVTRREIKVDLSQNISEANNPVLRNNDVVVVGRTGLASFSDGLESILGPIFRVLPIVNLF